MLTIIPGVCTCDNRVVDKTNFITFGTGINCDVYNECNVMNPVFLLKYTSSLVNCNYLKVQAWDRYYFVNSATVAPGGRIYLSCNEDVLMSNKDEILNLTAYVHRSESQQEHYLVDEKVPSLITTFRTHQGFNGGFTSVLGFNYLLTVKGGKLASN